MKQVAARPQSAARSAGLRVWNAARLLLLVVAATLVARNIALLGDRCRWVVACPYENEYGEGVLLWNAGMFAQGRSPYHDYNRYPFVAATYPPLYPLAAAVGVKLFGVSMAFGRVLSCLATLAVVGLIWVIVRRTVRARASPWLGSALFLAAPIVLWWAPLMRVEMAAVAVGLAGLYCVLRGGRWLFPAVVLLAAAVYTRQSAVAPVAAAVVYLAWIGRRRSAALVAVSWAVLVLGVFAVMQVGSHGWFYRNLVVANRNLWVPAGLWRLWKAAFLSWPLPFLMGAIGAAVVLVDAGIAAFRRQSHRSDHADRSAVRPLLLFGLYFVFAMAASLTAGKIGANINYMIEPLAAACIMTGFAYDWLAARLASWPGRVAWTAAAVILAASLVAPLVSPPKDLPPTAVTRANIMAGGDAAIAYIRAAKGDVLCEDTALPLLAGRPLLLDPHKMTSMCRDYNWDQRPLIEDIERRRFALIILEWDPIAGATDKWGCYGNYRWTIGMGRAIMRHYYLVKKAGFLYILAPADAQHPSCEVLHRQLVAERERRR